MLNTSVNGKIHGLSKAYEGFSSIFQGKLNFQGLFKTVLYILVLFKPVRTLNENVQPHVDCETATKYSAILFLNLGQYIIKFMQ